MSLKKNVYLILLFAFIAGCQSTKTEIVTPPLSEYFPLTVGKYLIYRLDSTVATSDGIVNNGKLVVRSYRVKDLVEAEITDALGRKSYRIVRSISDTNGVLPYRNIATLLALNTGDWVEYVDNNLRFMKMRFPVQDAFEWKGNSFIDASSASSNLRYLNDWTYRYEKINQPFTTLGKTYANTISVFQADETSPPGPFDPKFYQQVNKANEVYAKGIGLVYKKFLHTLWQGPTAGSPPKAGYYDDETYGVEMRLIEHN